MKDTFSDQKTNRQKSDFGMFETNIFCEWNDRKQST